MKAGFVERRYAPVRFLASDPRSDQSKVTAVSMPFQQGLPDTLLLQSHSAPCSLDEARAKAKPSSHDTNGSRQALNQVAQGEQLLIQAGVLGAREGMG